jgi:putative spermidine/putrescine transport system permease protein
LLAVGASGHDGIAAYATVLTHPRYLRSIVTTVVLAGATTIVSLTLATTAGLFLVRRRFAGRDLLVSLMTLPLAFPGVVIGFLVILIAGRQGLIGTLTQALFGDKITFAYTLWGLFAGYCYFSIPRVLLTVMAAAEKLDPALEEAARSLGAGPWRLIRDVLLPGLRPALIASGAICFATAMGAFGTAFTLATQFDVLPITIYNAFTLDADIATAAALSVVLGVVSWAILLFARSFAGSEVAAAG